MRWGTLVAWYELLRGGRRRRDSEDFLNAEPRRITFDQPLESETNKNDISRLSIHLLKFLIPEGNHNRHSDSLGGGSLQYRLDFDASAIQPGRVSIFMEHPFEEKEKEKLRIDTGKES